MTGCIKLNCSVVSVHHGARAPRDHIPPASPVNGWSTGMEGSQLSMLLFDLNSRKQRINHKCTLYKKISMTTIKQLPSHFLSSDCFPIFLRMGVVWEECGEDEMGM